MSSNVPVQIGHYQLGKALGIGSFGKVKLYNTTILAPHGDNNDQGFALFGINLLYSKSIFFTMLSVLC